MVESFDSNSDQKPFSDRFGKLKAYQKIWGELDKDGNLKDTYFKELKTEKCKLEEINFDGDADEDAYNFYQPAPEF